MSHGLAGSGFSEIVRGIRLQPDLSGSRYVGSGFSRI